MERWYWIELIGFDNESPDFGVDSFLSRNVTTTGVSLLFSHIDFLFADGEILPPAACSYGGHEYNRERRRQDWTVTQLRGLVNALKERGIKVFLSCFDMTKSITDPAWLSYGSGGTPRKTVYPIKRIGDRYVGDEIIDRISRAIDLYGFDGLQLADGLSSNRRAIESGDFSVSFCADSGIDIPTELMGEDIEAYAKRREWILKNARIEWTKFIADRWADIDFENRRLSVKRSIYKLSDGKAREKDPKTKSSIRTISIPERLCKTLTEYRLQQNKHIAYLGDGWKNLDYVFTEENGYVMNPQTPTRQFSKFLKRHGIRHLKFHGLRHTSATMLLANGCDIKTVSSRLGHADITTTNIYVHALESSDRLAAQTFDSFLSKTQKDKDDF